jgi:hypothetical protein
MPADIITCSGGLIRSEAESFTGQGDDVGIEAAPE